MNENRVLSLGMGVQSTALYLMSAMGQLPRIDFAVFSDTGREMTETMKYLEWLLKWKDENNGPEIIVKKDMNLFKDLLSQSKTGFSDIPVHIIGDDGKKTILKRQCTYKYKIDVINKEIRKYYKIQPKKKNENVIVKIWQGISTDEAHRMNTPDRGWKHFVYPFIGFGVPGKGKYYALPENETVRMSRQDIKQWYFSNGFKTPIKSGCVFCPYHSDHHWLDMKLNHPMDFADAVKIDEHIRNQYTTRSGVFLHSKCKPLNEIEFDPTLKMDLGDCTGNCHI